MKEQFCNLLSRLVSFGRILTAQAVVWFLGCVAVFFCVPVHAGCPSGQEAGSDGIYFSKSGDGRGYFPGVNPVFSEVVRSGRAPSVMRMPFCGPDYGRPFPSLHLVCRAGPLGKSERDTVSPILGRVQIRRREEDPRALNVVDPADWFSLLVRSRLGARDAPPYFQANGVLTIMRGEAMYTLETRIMRDSLAYSTETSYEIKLDEETAAAVAQVALAGSGEFLTLNFDAGDSFRIEAGYLMSNRLWNIISEMAGRCPDQ